VKRDSVKRGSSTPPKGLPVPGKIDIQESSVADDSSKEPGPFDVRTVKALVALMTEHDLSEIDLRDGDKRVRLRRGTQAIATAVLPAAPLTATMAPAAASATANNPPAAPAVTSKKLIDIKSPMVGTFYASPNPGADPFVKVGSKVSSNSIVGLIEAMKLFNELNAECTGVIVEILVDNQQPVEFGQVLMRVDPAA